ncbi:hypothetical protein SAY87_020951 [Trapa incisa]|uniref:Pathogenesis-related homeodomain protein n=1 Tax=Trapa incisa TaxID=236973 RepID=A0AAN7JWH1_9MYRT|nr:hypothetical protein SAY87_020951 [Trapa incisa]
MTGKRKDRCKKTEIVSECLQPICNEMIDDSPGLNSAEVIKLHEKRSMLASEGRGALKSKQNIGSCSGILSNDPSSASHKSGIRNAEVEINGSLATHPIKQPNVLVNAEPVFESMETCPEDGTSYLAAEQFKLPAEAVSDLDNVAVPARKLVRKQGRKKKKDTRRVKKKYMLRSSHGNKRALRPMEDKKSKNLSSNNKIGNANANEESKRTQRKKKRTREVTVDECSRIRKNLSYMLNRIRYEQSLIEAYSSEGWKGLSLEKLKPEKELERATSEIVRRKLKIRDLFQRLDSMFSEGMLPETLFDKEGMISSEDIFCAKCGSKDLTLDNDIILCDGACVRGFHQFCLQPPLLKEDIPPDDEGWLCPTCDCKVYCIDMLNESQGTNLSITDDWEKVFPEAAKAGNQDSAPGFSSDDSEDEDFDPDRPCTHKKVQTDESSSDAENATDSDNSEPQPRSNQYLGLPSDDSEDDDYDADVPNPCIEEERSSTDFTSDSEDLEAVLMKDDPRGSNGVAMSLSPKGKGGPKRVFEGSGTKQTISDELKSLMEPEPGESVVTPVSARRTIERLDYKKLYDETYGRTSSDSSDDEDWGNTSRKQKRSDKEEKQQKDKANVCINKTRGRQKPGSTNTSTADKASGGKHQPSSERLGETAKKRLYDAFNLNHYPDRATKESLAAELGITWQKVDKWFGNARWCLYHPEGRKANVSGKDVKKDNTRLPQADTNSNRKRLPKGDQAVGISEADTNSNRKRLPNGDQAVGISEANVSLPESSRKKEEKGKKLTELSEKSKNRKGSTLKNSKDKTNRASAGHGR